MQQKALRGLPLSLINHDVEFEADGLAKEQSFQLHVVVASEFLVVRVVL